jgi:hypothetical protein
MEEKCALDACGRYRRQSETEFTAYCKPHSELQKEIINAEQGIVENEIRSAWLVFCDECDSSIPEVAFEEFGGPSPEETGECPVCGSELVMFEGIDPSAQMAIHQFLESQ